MSGVIKLADLPEEVRDAVMDELRKFVGSDNNKATMVKMKWVVEAMLELYDLPLKAELSMNGTKVSIRLRSKS
jgi:hypothetical protein